MRVLSIPGKYKWLPQRKGSPNLLIKVFEQFHAVPLLAANVFLLAKQAFKLSSFQKIIKQLLNSVLAGYED